MPAYDAEAYRRLELAGYETVAADYDRWLSRATAQFAEPLLDRLDLRPGHQVLDAACGPGVLTLRLLPRIRPGGQCLGVDFSPRMVELALTNAANVRGVRFAVMDVERLALPDASFDRAACGFGLMHVPDAGRALAELHRILKPDGRVALLVWAQLARVEFMRLMLETVKAVAPDAGFPPGPPMFGFGTEAALGPLLQAAGFVQPAFAECSVELVFPTFEAWWNALVCGAARLGGVVRALPPAAQAEFERRLRERVKDRMGPQGLTLQGAAFIATAVNPGA